MGRPKIDNPKAAQITVRLDDVELEKLKESAAFFNETKVETLRRGIEMVHSEIKKK